MNKKQLIEALKEFPEDAEITLIDNNEDMDIGTIAKIWFDNRLYQIVFEN